MRPAHFENVPNVFFNRYHTTFDFASDEMDKDRFKGLHQEGIVAKVEWKPVVGNPYSGIYATGSRYVIARLS